MGFPPGKSFYDEWDLPLPPRVECRGEYASTRACAKRVPANCELDGGGGARVGQHKFDQTDAFSGITNNPVQYSLFFPSSASRTIWLLPPTSLLPLTSNHFHPQKASTLPPHCRRPVYPIHTLVVLMMIIYTEYLPIYTYIAVCPVVDILYSKNPFNNFINQNQNSFSIQLWKVYFLK